LLSTNPESARSHCDRCGATTIDRCPTCGQELPGALAVPFRPIGSLQPPKYCSNCGTAFPWTTRTSPVRAPEALARLEALLRRVPEVVRQLRVRHADRPPFRVQDDFDLEDLVRALLPIHFNDIRPECRSPGYSATNRVDFLLAAERVAVTVKHAGPQASAADLARQVEEDVGYYRRGRGCQTLVCFVYDPEGVLRFATIPEVSGPDPDATPNVRWVVSMPQ
jgi:hypothetical protein